jgi:hypothetical protein
MKSKPFLRNLARHVLNIFIVLCCISGCSSSTTPTYSRQDVEKSIQRILREEYKIGVKSKLLGQTLWIYLPLKSIFEKADKPDKLLVKFKVEENDNEFKGDLLRLNYLIKVVPENEKIQEYRITKSAMKKINNVWDVLRRVILSMDKKSRAGIKFCCLVVADIKNGFEMKEIFYCQDILKVTYRIISPGEYQHRVSFDSAVSLKIIGDREGRHLNYKDLSLRDFVAEQIKHRINLKFQKPEVNQNADIDKEIEKIILETINIYGLGDISVAELNNLFTNNKVILNKMDISRGSID